MEHLSSDHKDRLNQHENSHKLCNETEHPVVNLIENQWKLRQQHKNFPMVLKAIVGHTSVRRKKEIQKSRIENHGLGSK